MTAQATLLRARPGLARRLFAAGLSREDRAVIARRPDLVARGLAMGVEATRQGGTGLVEDLRAVMRPWGFRLEEIGAPTTVWQGDRDRSIPPRFGERLTEAIPGARLRPCPGEGHLLLADRLAEVLECLSDAV